MPPLYDDPRDAGRTRIKGTDPRVRNVTDRIGRGYQPTADATARQVQAPGSDFESVRRAFLENRDMGFEDNMLELRPRPRPRFPDDTRAKPGHFIATHETDIKNLESIRREGIRPSTGGANFDDPRPQTYGMRGGGVEDIPEGRVRIRYQAPEKDIIGRGTGGPSVSTRGGVPSENVMSGYGRSGRIFDAGSTTLGLMSLLGTAAQFIPGFSERMPRTTWLANGGPLGDVLQAAIASNYAPGGVMDPYRDMRDENGNIPGYNPQTGTISA